MTSLEIIQIPFSGLKVLCTSRPDIGPSNSHTYSFENWHRFPSEDYGTRVQALVSWGASNSPGGGGVLDISLGGEVRRGPSYPDPV